MAVCPHSQGYKLSTLIIPAPQAHLMTWPNIFKTTTSCYVVNDLQYNSNDVFQPYRLNYTYYEFKFNTTHKLLRGSDSREWFLNLSFIGRMDQRLGFF